MLNRIKTQELEKRTDKTNKSVVVWGERTDHRASPGLHSGLLWSFSFRPFPCTKGGRFEVRGCMSVPFQCKCAQYWPDQGCWTYGNIRVSVEDVTVLVDYTVRKFCIQQVLFSNSFSQLSLWLCWPLRGQSPLSLRVVKKDNFVLCLDSETRVLGSRELLLWKLRRSIFMTGRNMNIEMEFYHLSRNQLHQEVVYSSGYLTHFFFFIPKAPNIRMW